MSSIGPVVSEEKMFENVDGQRSHWYTISSPIAKKVYVFETHCRCQKTLVCRNNDLAMTKIFSIFLYFHFFNTLQVAR